MDKSTQEEYLAQPLQTNKKQYKISVTFLAGYNGTFNVQNSNNKFYFKKILIEKDFIQITIPSGAYGLEKLNKEIRRIIIDKGHYSDDDCPFTIKPNFSTLGSIIEINPPAMIGFVYDDSVRNLLGFHETMLIKEYNQSDIPVDILSFDNIFIHTDIALGMIFKGKRSGIIHNFTRDVSPGYRYIEKFRGGIQWYIIESKDFISSINFKFENEIGEIVSFNGQSITFRLSIREV